MTYPHLIVIGEWPSQSIKLFHSRYVADIIQFWPSLGDVQFFRTRTPSTTLVIFGKTDRDSGILWGAVYYQMYGYAREPLVIEREVETSAAAIDYLIDVYNQRLIGVDSEPREYSAPGAPPP